MSEKRLKLNDLTVQSFVTELKGSLSQTVKGGATTVNSRASVPPPSVVDCTIYNGGCPTTASLTRTRNNGNGSV